MSCFQLDPQSLAQRSTSAPSFTTSLLRGTLGFTAVSIAGFLPWGVFGKAFHGQELRMYLVCAVVFLMLSGVLMHRLIMGKGSLGRFYLLFGITFTLYAIAWIAGWMLVRGDLGSIVGLLSGTVVMGGLLCVAFEAKDQWWQVITALFVLNTLGYFLGGVIEVALLKLPVCTFAGITLSKPTQVMLAKMQWAVCYGSGLGAGLGIAFHCCQTRARALLGAKA